LDTYVRCAGNAAATINPSSNTGGAAAAHTGVMLSIKKVHFLK
jgi:hypothetical protein